MHEGEITILSELILLLVVSLPITFLFHKIRVPALVGFLITGMILGPYGAAMITDTKVVQQLAEIGVVLLLFTIGIEFSIEDIMRSSRHFIIGGGLQVLLTIFATAAIAGAFGISFPQAIFFGFLTSLSSTAIVLKMYSDRTELDSAHGKLATGILLFQDVAVVPMMLLLPVLGQVQTIGEVTVVSVFFTLGKAIILIGVIFIAARKIVPYLLHYVVGLKNREILFLFVVLICLGTAWITYSLGLSLALGAFIAGLIISESEYSHHIVSSIMPFKDYFSSIFFVSIGMMLKPEYLTDHWLLILGMASVLIITKTVLVTFLARLLRYPFRSSLLAGLGLAQIGEFSFLLAQQGSRHGLITGDAYQIFINTSILSMLAAPLIIQSAPYLVGRLQKRVSHQHTDKGYVCTLTGHTIIAGYGLNGKNLARTLKAIGIPYVIIDVNVDTIRRARAEGEPIIYGDITREDVFVMAGADCAKVVVFAISDFAATRTGILIARKINPNVFILVRTRYAAEVDELIKTGADQVIPEEFETSIEIFSRVLHQYHVPSNIINNQIRLIRSEGYSMLRNTSIEHERIDRIAALFAETTVDTFQIPPGSYAVGKSLRELNLRKVTGATVIAVAKGGQAITNPGPDIRLEQNDIIVLMAAHKELDMAVRLLTKGIAE